MKLSKPKIKAHEQALELLKKPELSYEEKLFVYENWTPMYAHQVNKAGVFFTPPSLAADLCIEILHSLNLVDLCAGIGMLSFTYYHWCNQQKPKITCVEINPEFVAVGKKLLPEANWICADALTFESPEKFDAVISNPPFGKIQGASKAVINGYNGSDFEYKVIARGKSLSDYGVFIIPQMSCSFKYSGQNNFEKQLTDKYLKFERETGIKIGFNCGIDTSHAKEEWDGASPTVEIACVDYTERPELDVKPAKPSATTVIQIGTIEAPGEEYHGEAILETVFTKPTLEQMSKHNRWWEILGNNPNDFTTEERRERWERWKQLAADDEAGRAMVDYWAKDNVDEACAGCKHRDKDWCNLQGLPCNVNPVLTIKDGIIGMACMGAGYESDQPAVETLQEQEQPASQRYDDVGVGDTVRYIDKVKNVFPLLYCELGNMERKVVSIDGKIATLDNGTEIHIGWLTKVSVTQPTQQEQLTLF